MIQSIANHKSTRKYKSDPIPDSILNEILLAGSRASNTGNIQAYSIIVTQNPEIKEKLWLAHLKQEMVLKAPIIITFCSDFHRVSKWCTLNNAKPGFDNFQSFMAGAIDCLLASQNVATEAIENGLGICYLGTTTYNAANIIEILSLPRLVVPVTSLVVGYPDGNTNLTDRLPLEAVIHNDNYQIFSNEKIRELYQEKEENEFYRNLVKINNKESLAQIITDIRYQAKDNRFFSKEYLKAIEDQGFMNHED